MVFLGEQPSDYSGASFLMDLTRVKSIRACLPRAGAIPRPPSQARPDLQASAPVESPLPAGLRPAAIGP